MGRENNIASSFPAAYLPGPYRTHKNAEPAAEPESLQVATQVKLAAKLKLHKLLKKLS